MDSDDEETLQDSTVYTSYTRKPLLLNLDSSSKCEPTNIQTTTAATTNNINSNTATAPKSSKNPLQSLLSPRSRNSFQRYFHAKASKTPNSTHGTPPEGASAAVPVTPSPQKPRSSVLQKLRCRVTGSTPEKVVRQTESSGSEEKFAAAQVEALLNSQRIMNSASRRRPATGTTESQIATPPRSGRSPRKESFSPIQKDFIPEASPSSCLEFSFVSSVDNLKTTDWTLDAISPIMTCGAGRAAIHDDAASIEMSLCNPLLVDSGFDADADRCMKRLGLQKDR